MTLHPVLIITAMTACSFSGGLCFKYFADTRDILWLVAGYSLYSLANALWILIIGESGIARAMVLASSAQIVLTTLAGFYFGERIDTYGVAAALLACVASGLSVLGSAASATSPHDTLDTNHKEQVDEGPQ